MQMYSPLEQPFQLPACLLTQMMMKVYLAMYIHTTKTWGQRSYSLFLTQMVRVKRRREEEEEEEEGKW